jgi:hypothetical protein
VPRFMPGFERKRRHSGRVNFSAGLRRLAPRRAAFSGSSGPPAAARPRQCQQARSQRLLPCDTRARAPNFDFRPRSLALDTALSSQSSGATSSAPRAGRSAPRRARPGEPVSSGPSSGARACASLAHAEHGCVALAGARVECTRTASSPGAWLLPNMHPSKAMRLDMCGCLRGQRWPRCLPPRSSMGALTRSRLDGIEASTRAGQVGE